MPLPARVIITLAIILGIGVGTGALVYGIMFSGLDSEAFIAWGAAILASSVAALIAHLAGGFRDLDEDR